MDRWIRFSAAGAHLAWRVKNGAKSVPSKTIRTLPDGSELVMLRESDGMRARRRRDTGDPHAERLPDTTARLVAFTVTARTRSGRTKTSLIRVLTTLLDHETYPAREIAALYAERWQVVTADTCCRHCGRRPGSPGDPLAGLLAAILALPRHRDGRQRTSGRTSAERRTRHTEEVGYTIDITKSNLPEWDKRPES